jgi:dipeptidyl aminopeptidase/acylaminoacyl peptidase
MEEDIRASALYREIESLCSDLLQPGTGQISDAAEIHGSPGGNHVVFAGTIVEALRGSSPSRICLTDLGTGSTRVLSAGPNTDRSPKYSPDGRRVAFLSDRGTPGDFQLYLLDPCEGHTRAAPAVAGWVEYFHWSTDGSRILLGVAGHGADVAGGQGAVTSKRAGLDVPSWMPVIKSGDEDFRWRTAWIYELATDSMRQIATPQCNIWEAAWCGDHAVVAVVSSGPEEGHWYGAHLALVDIDSGERRELYRPGDQLGCPAASPSGQHLAIVEAICSDRLFVAGDLRLIDIGSGAIRSLDTHGVDITCTHWRSNDLLLLAGHRGLETVVGLYDASSNAFTEVWSSQELTTGGFYVSISGINETGDCVLVGESFTRAPEIGVIRRGQYRTVRSFDLAYGAHAKAIALVEPVSWQAHDGLEIQGWLLHPHGERPYPLVMIVHGGPVALSRPVWLGRRAGAPHLELVKRGYAVFFPNPRGSTGRGQAFARKVCGDLGGAETLDLLSGLDDLVGRGLADPARLGVSGVSHGGFMTSWLVTRDTRFAAAVSVSPITNYLTQHLISNIPEFVALFLADQYHNLTGRYLERSPIMHAHKAKTPTLNICGSLDRCTPPEEAVQFHNALRESGVKSVLAIYPEEGHGIRRYPAAIDYTARMVDWFEEHMPAKDRKR